MIADLITTTQSAALAGLHDARVMYRPSLSMLKAENRALVFPQMRAASEPVRRSFRLAFRLSWRLTAEADARQPATQKEKS